ncbi:LysR family transcriptional regulator [Saccharopolyspora oryzae]|uniref:LysR family transcriptional regulator n=1 Tax=Saccharopolyspora oryzae TaxID=2997343 RepID=A0ABT4UUD7_9PSEU|nr:LysR family transcriptional regulator [Saccharopolyspora oryzae]MDA3624811.1 LysR family transcriptional regulator [Saccharopolyspora oryzae]
MAGLETRELECFLVLAEELHFGRTGERLYVSQGRVSQLLRSLERRIGARLVERTNRRVALTPLGERFRDSLQPAYAQLSAVVEQARAEARGVTGVLRLGFQGPADECVVSAIRTFESRFPSCTTELTELPLNDPFSALRRGEVDAAIVLLPVEEPDLLVAATFPAEQQHIAISAQHAFADRDEVSAEDLADLHLIAPASPAPTYWQDAQTPPRTPSGRPIPRASTVTTLQEAITRTAAGQGAMLLCGPTAQHHARRDIRFVPVTGLPPSTLGLTYPRAAETSQLRAFAATLAEA